MVKPHILVVDDEEDLRMVLKDKLESSDFTVSTAADGEEGLSKAIKEQPDLILLDILMPKMDGKEMLKKLRDDEWGKDARVILLTNSAEMSDIYRSVESHAEDYMVKTDWSLDEVVEKIKKKLQ